MHRGPPSGYTPKYFTRRPAEVAPHAAKIGEPKSEPVGEPIGERVLTNRQILFKAVSGFWDPVSSQVSIHVQKDMTELFQLYAQGDARQFIDCMSSAEIDVCTNLYGEVTLWEKLSATVSSYHIKDMREIERSEVNFLHLLNFNLI